MGMVLRRSMWLMLGAIMALAVSGRAEESGWSTPLVVVQMQARLAAGNQVHVVGHANEQLVHRSSPDHGDTWGQPTVIGEAARNFPMMYGGLCAVGDSVYLLTAEGFMGGEARQLDFRRSDDNGATWSKPVRVTDSEHPVFRARVVVSGEYVHVGGQGSPKLAGSMLYFRSCDGGKTWEQPRVLAKDLGEYGGGQTIAVDGNTVHIVYTKGRNGVGAGDSFYVRSVDNGKTWSEPVLIGETSKESSRQARLQIVAAKEHVLVIWQREAEKTGVPVPAMRLGYNTSADGGRTWDGPKILPGEATNRNHQQICLRGDGTAYVCWREDNGKIAPLAYMWSKNYGKDWEKGGLAINTNGIDHPFSIDVDDVAVHVLFGSPEKMLYSRRRFEKPN